MSFCEKLAKINNIIYPLSLSADLFAELQSTS